MKHVLHLIREDLQADMGAALLAGLLAYLLKVANFRLFLEEGQ